jgi:glutathione-specific gamma-glutamylcyclotransferase
MTDAQESDFISVYPVDPMPPEIAVLRQGAGPVWLFAYGSLMWNPGFAAAERRPARLYGYHRRFCLYSRDYRGTPERPGLVLGLDRGGSCHGIVYRLPPGRNAEALDRIWAREMTGMVYRMRRVTVETAAGRLAAYACIVRRDAPDYAGRMPLEDVARLLATAVGSRGSGRDYLANTLQHLVQLGIEDRELRRVAAQMAGLDAVEAGFRAGDNAPVSHGFTARGQ